MPRTWGTEGLRGGRSDNYPSSPWSWSSCARPCKEFHSRICRCLQLLTFSSSSQWLIGVNVQPSERGRGGLRAPSPGHGGSHAQAPLGTMQRVAIWVTCGLT